MCGCSRRREERESSACNFRAHTRHEAGRSDAFGSIAGGRLLHCPPVGTCFSRVAFTVTCSIVDSTPPAGQFELCPTDLGVYGSALERACLSHGDDSIKWHNREHVVLSS